MSDNPAHLIIKKKVRGYSPARDPPGDLPEELLGDWQEDTMDWDDPLMLEWYKQKVYNFFGAQVCDAAKLGATPVDAGVV